MSYNHLEDIREIIALLKAENLDELASKLQGIMDNTFSGTELIMAIRFNLKDVSKYKISLEAQKRIESLIDHIDKLLV
jgi:hypothetical protein